MVEQLLIRADADTQIGTGHLMRCLALSQNWIAKGRAVTMITCCKSESLRKRLSAEGIQVIRMENPHPNPQDWEITSQALRKHSGAWVVLDGYHFDPEYQSRIKNAGHRLLVVDDTAHLEHYYADILLNQNLYAEKLKYSCQTPARRLFGTQYVLLRSEFLAWRGWKRELPDVAHKILVTLGGSDPTNATLKIIESIKATNIFDLEVKIVAGASNPHMDKLQSSIQSTRCKMSILYNVVNMPELMSWADLAVAAGGITCWEMAFMKLPFASVVLANNQSTISGAVERAGIAVSFGWHNQLDRLLLAKRLVLLIRDKSARAAMSAKGATLVDGLGADRTINAMEAEK
jgi:UDP-2,4-diacetamido-2,4,6-trideoxy-beta-L-altropyranose hydrolase